VRNWYRFQNSGDPTVAELLIFDDIGKSWWNDEAITAKQFIDDLKALPQAVTKIVVRVNSLGGDVFDAIAIANALRDQARTKNRTIETVVEGIAASAATLPVMAGSTIRISDNAIFMVHDPYTIEVGNAAQMRKTADALDTVRDTIVATYKWHSSRTEDEIKALMRDETWMDATAALEHGFATEKIEGLQAAASIDPRAASTLKVPDKFKARVDALLKKDDPLPAAAAPLDVVRACKAADCESLAEELIAAALPMDQVTMKINAAKTERTARDTRATEIRALCATAKLPELADDYIAGGMSPEKVRAQLVTVTAKLSGVEIDNKIPDRTTESVAASWKKVFAGAGRGFGTKKQ
jgi:ATP-dependent Clp protease protease subunit